MVYQRRTRADRTVKRIYCRRFRRIGNCGGYAWGQGALTKLCCAIVVETLTRQLQGGSIRGFLNDGSVDYKNHHHLEELAFGHCDYSYRNLGRPSRIHLLQDSNGFEVIVDDNRCFRSDQVDANHLPVTKEMQYRMLSILG